MRRRTAAVGVVGLLGAPTALAFFSGGYFDRPRLLAALAAWVLVALMALVASEPAEEASVRPIAQSAGPEGSLVPRGVPGRMAVGGLLALGLLAAVSATWAPLRGPALDDASRSALYLAALLLAAALLRDRRASGAAEPALLAGIVVVILAGLSERLLPSMFELARSSSSLGRLEQPLTYWNAVGALAAIGLVLALRVAGDAERGTSMRAAASAAAAPLGAGLLLTFSRGALLAAAVGVVVLCVLLPTPRQLRAAARGLGVAAPAGALAALLPAVATLEGSGAARQAQGAVLLVGLLLLMAGAAAVSLRSRDGQGRNDALRRRDGGERVGVLHRPGGERADVPHRLPARAVVTGVAAVLVVALGVGALDSGPGQPPADGATAARLASTGSNRYDYWQVAASAFAGHPLRGVGAGGFRTEWLRERPIDDEALDAHGLAIEVAAELGILGLAALALLFGGVALAARRAIGRDRALAAGPTAALVAWGLHAQIDWDWEMPALTLVAVVLAGALIAGSDPASGSTGDPTSEAARTPRPAWAARFALVAASAVITVALAAALRSSILTDRAIDAARAPGRLDEADYARVRDLLRRAGRWNPDPNPEVIDASLLISRGRVGEAVAPLESILRAEPANAGAWRLLAVAVRSEDPGRSADAERRARALAPRRPG